MSIEQIILARSKSYIKGAQAQEILNREAFKSCNPELSAVPINLEPAYHDFQQWQRNVNTEEDVFVPSVSWNVSDLLRVSCSISPNHHLDWIRGERFIKQLCHMSHRIGFEIMGNCDQIRINFLVHKNDAEFFKSAFAGEFLECQLNTTMHDSLFSGNLFFYDFYYATSPYHHLQTQPVELRMSPYESFIRTIAGLPISTTGFVQILFEPARFAWQQNVQHLTDLQYMGKFVIDPASQYRTLQMPSGELKNLAMNAETKAHDDKPFYYAALRLGVCTCENHFDIRPLKSFTGLILKDGEPAHHITEKEYRAKFNSNIIRDMFYKGVTYRPGTLLNSSELVSLVHIPFIKIFIEEGIIMDKLEPLSLPKNHHHLLSGIKVGKGWFQGKEIVVCLHDNIRNKSTHVIGKPGTGKTTTLEYMILQKIFKGLGCVLIDPHGDSVKRLLKLIPQNRIESTIYIDFGDPEWVPLWNPLKRISEHSIGRMADDLVAAIKSVVQRNSWGDRLEHILRNCFSGLLHLDDPTFFDLLILLEQSKTVKGDRQKKLITRMLDQITNEVLRLFWERDFHRYRRDDFAPPLHKLSKLLSSDETVSLMLTQPENRFDFSDIMDSNKTVLLDLSNLGPDNKEIMGSFLLSFLHHSALSRNKLNPDDRKPFAIFCDEAHKLTTDTLEDMIAENRKFEIELTMAHQFMSQFPKSQQDALSSAGTTIIFNVDVTDANHFTKTLQKKVTTEELITLNRGEAVARIENDIIKLKTPHPDQFPEENENTKKAIIQRSHELYCRRTKEVRKYLQSKQNRSPIGLDSFEGLTDNPRERSGADKTTSYDEFE